MANKLVNPPDPFITSINGDTYIVATDFHVEFGIWLEELQFVIPAGTETDIASIPRLFRWINDRASLGILAPVVHDVICAQNGIIQTLDGRTIKITYFDAAILMLILLRLDGISIRRSLIAFLGVVIAGPKF